MLILSAELQHYRATSMSAENKFFTTVKQDTVDQF